MAPGTPGTSGGHGAAFVPVSNLVSAQSGPGLAQTGGASPVPLILAALLLMMIGAGILTRRTLTR
ncbi:hypothetical protein RS86_01290 [Microbacterium azadirachtae]|uniref:Gram-positive cocci surface proteins LPxTG domain-containing protein n=1 Tax=Microbacterium azadirachtae TaxID=582680 RepID=A0A0F0LND9_9MICO|nr:hypothetical protein RS86_01290 [Microbacterium azadirachtae]